MMDLWKEWQWRARIQYLASMKFITVLEYYGCILGITLAIWLGTAQHWILAVFVFCTLRLITAHQNANYIADSLNARDQYTLYPLF